MQKLILISGTIFGALGVALGAFGAHALKKTLEASGRLDTFETAVKYQFYHALTLLLLGLLMFHLKHHYFQYAGLSFIFGIVVFSGSLYVLCLSGITKFGMITPIGGLLLIAGWVLLMLGLIKSM
ncbi:MAG: DUF423 domain-containing protein [Cyclobacteriaceae bacterium]|nr:DUF423 domain-containing protein [Cyclobacteriaceae bacterium]